MCVTALNFPYIFSIQESESQLGPSPEKEGVSRQVLQSASNQTKSIFLASFDVDICCK